MVNQIAIASGMIGVCEAMLYAQRAGLDVARVIDTIKDGAAGSWSLSNYGPRLLRGDLEPGFKIDHFVKDLGIALAEARRMRLPLTGTALAEQLYVAAQAAGLRRQGHPGAAGHPGPRSPRRADSYAEPRRRGGDRLRGRRGQRPSELLGRALLREGVSLAGPQVDQVGVAGGATVRAQRRGEMVDLGIGGGASAACSRCQRLAIPRAVRPLNARVSTVGASVAVAARCAATSPPRRAQVTRSRSARRSRPATSTAADRAPVMIEPAATSGSIDAARMSCSAASSVSSDWSSSSENTPGDRPPRRPGR